MEENRFATLGSSLLTGNDAPISIEDLIAAPAGKDNAIQPFNISDLPSMITIGDVNAGKIKVLSIPSDKTGVGKYRSIDPHKMLHRLFKDEFYVEINPTPDYEDMDYFKKFNIVHIHKAPSNDYDNGVKIINKIKALGCKVILDTDDYWEVDSFNPHYYGMRKYKVNEKLRDIIKNADWVTTTTPIFADEIRKHNKHVMVIPNAIDPEEPQFIPKPVKCDRVRMGFLGGSCYDDSTEVLTDNGFKLFREIDENDKIATLNPITYELEYQIPTAYIEEPFDGYLNCASNKLIDYAVTPNHKMFISEQKYLNKGRKKAFELIVSENIQGKNMRFKRNCKWIGEEREYFTLPAYQYTRGNKIHIKPEIKILMDDWVAFFGFWLAEGWTTSRQYGQQSGICQWKDNDYLEVINNIMTKYGFKPYISLDGKQYRYCNNQLWEYLHQFGSAEKKYIPKDILQLSPRLLTILLDWFIKGDGNIEKGKYPRTRAWSSSKQLVDNIQEISLKIGIGVTITNRGQRTAEIKGRKINTQFDSYQIGVAKQSLISDAYLTPIVKSKYQYQMKYTGYVYCVEVPNHIIFVRRNGKGFWCGNSHADDIELLNGVANRFLPYKDKIQMVLVGFDLRGSMIEGIENGKMKRRAMTPEETVWHQYEKIFTSNWMLVSQFPDYLRYLQKYTPDPYDPNNDEVERNMPYRRLWTRDINNYARNYNNLDISLAPLEETKFNLYKSQLKVVEAGFFKKALVAQNYGAYTIDLINVFDGQNINPKGNAVLIDSLKNHKQWYQSLKRLVDNPELITMLGENLYETVKDKYDLRKVTTQRAEFYRSIL